MLEAVLGFEGGEGWVGIVQDKVWNTAPFDDPFAVLANVIKRELEILYGRRKTWSRMIFQRN